jgi:hypothetical protein
LDDGLEVRGLDIGFAVGATAPTEIVHDQADVSILVSWHNRGSPICVTHNATPGAKKPRQFSLSLHLLPACQTSPQSDFPRIAPQLQDDYKVWIFEREQSLVRITVIAIALAIISGIMPASAASLNSCANLDIIGTYDRSGLQESDLGISAVGTFRIQNQPDENSQPNFNLTMVNCEKQTDENGRQSLTCKIVQAVTWAKEEKPNTDNPNCSLDLDMTDYTMHQLQKGVLVGAEDSTNCFQSMLTIDQNTKRVYLSFTRTKYADNFDRIKPGTCGQPPGTQVLMNCTYWAKSRKNASTPSRYCDFSGVGDK